MKKILSYAVMALILGSSIVFAAGDCKCGKKCNCGCEQTKKCSCDKK